MLEAWWSTLVVRQEKNEMQPKYNYNNTSLAEKIGDVKLRQWCVEKLGVSIDGIALDFSNVDILFNYIKGRKVNAK